MKLFNINSPLMDFLDTTAQYVVLNVIFVICCLPIITIGPAVAALYQVILRETRGEHTYLIRKFFRHFKEMFLQALLTSLVFIVIIFILLFNLVFWNAFQGVLSNIILVILYLLLLLAACTLIYVFPLMARFRSSLIQTIKNSFFIAFTNLKATVFLLLIHAVTVGILYIFPPSRVFLLLIGFSFLAYCNSYLQNKVFKKYEPGEDAAAIEMK